MVTSRSLLTSIGATFPELTSVVGSSSRKTRRNSTNKGRVQHSTTDECSTAQGKSAAQHKGRVQHSTDKNSTDKKEQQTRKTSGRKTTKRAKRPEREEGWANTMKIEGPPGVVGEGQKGGGGAQNFAFFFFSVLPHFALCTVSGCLLKEFRQCWKCWGLSKMRFCGSSCETPAAKHEKQQPSPRLNVGITGSPCSPLHLDGCLNASDAPQKNVERSPWKRFTHGSKRLPLPFPTPLATISLENFVDTIQFHPWQRG